MKEKKLRRSFSMNETEVKKNQSFYEKFQKILSKKFENSPNSSCSDSKFSDGEKNLKPLKFEEEEENKLEKKTNFRKMKTLMIYTNNSKDFDEEKKTPISSENTKKNNAKFLFSVKEEDNSCYQSPRKLNNSDSPKKKNIFLKKF